MNVGAYTVTKKQLFIAVCLVLGIVITVIVANRQQIFRSRANDQVEQAVTITTQEGQPLTNTNGVYETQSPGVDIEFDVNRLNGE